MGPRTEILATSDSALRPFRGGNLGRALLFGLTTVFLWLALLGFPDPAALGLDSSWKLPLNYAWTHGLIFGRDVVWTHGPWSWLISQYYYPATFVGRLVWDLLFKALACILLVRFAVGLSWPRRILMIAAAAAVLPLFEDTLPILVLGGLALRIARDPRPAPPVLITVGLVLGFMALLKFTFFALAGWSIVLLALRFIQLGDWRSSFCLVGAAALSLVGSWLLAGQDLDAFLPFIQRSTELAAGYDEAMFLDGPPLVVPIGLACAALYLVLVWTRLDRSRLLVALLLSGLGFLLWKHGFVRADGHTLGFFTCMLFAGLAAPRLTGEHARWAGWVSWGLCTFAVCGLIASDPPLLANAGPLLRYHLTENTKHLLQLGQFRHELDRQYATTCAASNLPFVRARVGSASVDQFGHDQALLIFNALNYHPRPIMQGYQAYSQPLAALNADFYDSPKAPAFTLARLQTIDNRFPPLDDAALLPRLITDYEWVLNDHDFLLLQRRKRFEKFAPQFLTSGRMRYTVETAAVATVGNEAVWAKIDTPLSWLGWIRTFLYRPPEITLVVSGAERRELRFRLIAPAARAGFLLSPLLVNTTDLERLVARGLGEPVRNFRLEIPPGDSIYFLKRARYEIFTLPAVKFTAKTGPATTSVR